MRRDFGTITELERGKLYKVYWTEGGKRRSHRVHGTRKDASSYLASVQVRTVGANAGTTYDEYWEAVVQPSFDGLAPLTVLEYETMWSKHLQPKIGSKRVSETNFRNAQSVLSSIEAPSAKLKCKRLWSKICTMAVSQDGILAHNPLQTVRVDQPAPKAKAIWDVSDMPTVFEKVFGYKVEPLVLLSIGCGLRPEECFALDWEDLVFIDGTCYVNIERTLVLVANKAVEQGRTKTRGSRREAACAGYFADRLSMLAYGKSGPLMPSQQGGRTSPATIAHNWKSWCGRHGVTHVTFENMRTNYKTFAASALIPAELVRMQMGHAGATIAETNYLVSTRPIMRMVADMYWGFIEKNAPLCNRDA